MENRKKSIEELQAELTLEAEALGTLQLIYAEKVKQVRVNTLLPPDIQARFLSEWETFYQQRMTALFRKDYLLEGGHSSTSTSMENLPVIKTPVAPTPPATPSLAPPPMAMPKPVAPVAVSPAVSAPSAPPAPAPNNRPLSTPASASPPVVAIPPIPVAPPPPPMAPVKRNEPSPVMTPSINSEPALTDDILGVNTGSWMNPAESIGYEQYSDSEPISSTLMDSDKIQSSNDNASSSYDEELDDDESDSIDGFAATSGLKGLTEFMDFDLKRKKS